MRRIGRIDGEIVIDRPVEEVFDVVADERNEPRYNPQMLRVTQISSEPLGHGTQFRCEMARNVEMVWTITAYERPHRLAGAGRARVRLLMFRGPPAMEMQGTLTFEPVSGGTRMRWSWHLEPRGVFKLLTPLVERMGQRQEVRIWASLKQFLEGQEAAPAQA